ncbi:MAG: S9 family peptidase [Chloroflexota bacterium]
MSSDRRPLASDDLYRYQLVSDPQLSPDGQNVVFCIRTVERETEKKYTNLWLAAADGSRLRQFTYGKQADRQPRWSPDGRTIAFVSNRGNEQQAQLYLIAVDGGEARVLTTLEGSLATYEWSPDGTQLVVQFRKKDADAAEREKDEQKKKLGVTSRRIQRFTYKFDGAGYLPQEHWHIWTIDAATGEATQLTEGDFDETDPHWSPDGKSILFVSNRSADPDFYLDESELYLIPAAGGEMQQVPAHHGRKLLPAFSPDGRHIAYLGRRESGRWYQNASLFVTPVDGSSPAREISAGFDLQLITATTGDFSDFPAMAPAWSADGQRVYCQATTRGNQWLGVFDAFGEEPAMAWALDDTGVIGAFSFDAAGEQIAYQWITTDDPGQIVVRSLSDATAETRTLTAVNDWLAEIDHGTLEEVWVPSADGYDVHGWILKPPGFDPDKTYPSVLQIHGGPQMQFGNLYSHEFAYLAGQGYVVYWSNPRGGQGYGEAHAKAIFGQWGTVDYDDVMAWTDYMAQQPYIDPARMGLTGGSYGGYMTTLIIGRTDRFQAAVAQRVVSNFISFYGSSDLNWGLENLAGSPPPWEDMDANWSQSPISSIGNAKTPTMIFHSEQDNRCDLNRVSRSLWPSSGWGGHGAILFPGESHGLSRDLPNGPWRIVRLEHMARWFDGYLK